MLEILDHVDVGALVAPRAVLVETGTDDPIFAAPPARDAVGALRRVYEADGHRWNGTQAELFLDRWLDE